MVRPPNTIDSLLLEPMRLYWSLSELDSNQPLSKDPASNCLHPLLFQGAQRKLHSQPLPAHEYEEQQRDSGNSMGTARTQTPLPPSLHGPWNLCLPHHLLPRRWGGTLVVHSHRALSISSHLACRVAKAASDRSSICNRAASLMPSFLQKPRVIMGRPVIEAVPPHTRFFSGGTIQ